MTPTPAIPYETRWTVLGVPVDSVAAPTGGAPFGTELGPERLRELGHVDHYDHRSSSTGEAADMPVAALLGIGWQGWLDTLADVDSRDDRASSSVLAGRDVVVLGARDPVEAHDLADLPQRLGVTVLGPDRIDDTTGQQVLKMLRPQQFWLHLDLDVLDEVAFPATDYLMPGGLDLPALAGLLRPLGRSSRCIGVSVGCYNPSKDPTGEHGQALTELLVDVLKP